MFIFERNQHESTVFAAWCCVPDLFTTTIILKLEFWRACMCLLTPKSQFSVRSCAAPVGIQSGRIKNTAMTASSSYNVFHGPYLARLHRSRTGRYMGAWVARIRNANQYLQIALGRPMKITGIATQGRHDANQWVTRYLVAFSQDNMHFEYYMEYGNFKVCIFCIVQVSDARKKH